MQSEIDRLGPQRELWALTYQGYRWAARGRGNVPRMADMQKTQPKIGEPVEIPVPTKRDVLADLTKTARPKDKPKLRRARRKRAK